MTDTQTPVEGFPEYDRCRFAFGFPSTEVTPGEFATLLMHPTCDNIVFSVVEQFLIPEALAKKIHVEYALVSNSDRARELLRDVPGTRLSPPSEPVPLKHIFRPYETIILTVRNKSPETVRFVAAIIGWAYNAAREQRAEDPEEFGHLLARREALRRHIQAVEASQHG